MKRDLANLYEADCIAKGREYEVIEEIVVCVDQEGILARRRQQHDRCWHCVYMHGILEFLLPGVEPQFICLVDFNSGHQNILVPAHATSYSEFVLQISVREELPTSAINAVMSEASAASHSHVPSI